MSYDLHTARDQADALLTAADASPVRQFRYELRRRGNEWARAVRLLEGAEDEAVIELAGSIVPGMKVPMYEGTATVVRTMTRDGQFSIHVEGDDGRPAYLNHAGPSSPVVVLP